MTNGRVERRLAAVLAADVAGYSRLMGADEVGTLAALKAIRREVVDPAIASHKGRIVKTTGDGMLVEFGSAVDAVTCAVAVQEKMAGNGSSQIAFRIGINVGDIIFDEGDIFGDGVNVAARIENECDSGGVYLSAAAFDQVHGKTSFVFDDLGARSLKNIDRPVKLYAARIAAVPARKIEPQVSNPLALPDRPSIAVLPFQNMSGDPEQEYFADGMVEDIITALSQFKSLFVIARNSSFTYKGKAIDIKQVGRELGVRYVLEGSVRRSGSRVRINGQLIEAASGTHIWAEKIDGALEDVFALQDEVTSRVVGAIEPSIWQAEIGRAHRKPTSSLDAYDMYLRALSQYSHFTHESNDSAVKLMHRAIALDPNYALAKAFLSFNHAMRYVQGWGDPSDREKGLAFARDAISDDGNDPAVLRWAGHTLGFWGERDSALTLLEKASRLNVNGAQIWSSLGWVMNYACLDPDRAITCFERAVRLSPRDPEMAIMLSGMSMAHLIAGRNKEALESAQKAIDDTPRSVSAHRHKIVALVSLGRIREAEDAAKVFLPLDPEFRISTRVPILGNREFQGRYHAALTTVCLKE